MSRKQIKKIILLGLGCAVFLGAGVAYSLLYNNGRWVREMNLSEYTFSVKDLPMLAAGALIVLYAVYLAVLCLKRGKETPGRGCTRTLPPALGAFGLTGFLGFLGFWTYRNYGIIFPFIFFIFFGLFGLFYEGKLSGTLKDELFLQNKRNAELKAYKTGFLLLFLVIWLIGGGIFPATWNGARSLC